MAGMGGKYSKDEKWVKEKGKPFHPHPNVWRRKGLGLTKAVGPDVVGTPVAAAQPGVAAPAAAGNVNTSLILAVLGIIFLALNIPTGGFTLFLAFIVGIIGFYLAYQRRAIDPKNMWVTIGLMFNGIIVLVVIMVVLTGPGPGPNPSNGYCSSNYECADFGSSHCGGTSTSHVECGTDSLCHCAWGNIGCKSTAPLSDPSLYCDPATGVAYFKKGGLTTD
jgi:hypothetical protein